MPTKPFLVWWYIDYEGWSYEEFDSLVDARLFANKPFFGRKYLVTRTVS
jgi:hypothetical protein